MLEIYYSCLHDDDGQVYFDFDEMEKIASVEFVCKLNRLFNNENEEVMWHEIDVAEEMIVVEFVTNLFCHRLLYDRTTGMYTHDYMPPYALEKLLKQSKRVERIRNWGKLKCKKEQNR